MQINTIKIINTNNKINTENTSNIMTDDHGPWYERESPTAEYVRNDIFTKLRANTPVETGVSDETLKSIIMTHIPDTMTDFGSWRGYATFGLENKIMNSIINDVTNAKI